MAAEAVVEEAVVEEMITASLFRYHHFFATACIHLSLRSFRGPNAFLHRSITAGR